MLRNSMDQLVAYIDNPEWILDQPQFPALFTNKKLILADADRMDN